MRIMFDSSDNTRVKTTGMESMKMLPVFVVLLFSLVCFACEDITSTFSNRELVRCNFNVVTYRELFGVMGNYGQFASIRKLGTGKIKMTMAADGTSTEYQPDKIQQYFYYGLGGLIVGTNYNGDAMCYDLSCPYCDAAAYRLNLTDNGFAKCPHCGIIYDLNNNGIIHSIDSTRTYSKLRALYRYRITYNEPNVSMYN